MRYLGLLVIGAVAVSAILLMSTAFIGDKQHEEEVGDPSEARLNTISREDQTRMLAADSANGVFYVALGDSTVVGVGASHPQNSYVSRLYERLRAIYPTSKIRNLGISGATSADVLISQLPAAVAMQPHLITLSVGPNDITQGKDAQQYEQNIETIFQTLSRETGAVVVVNLLPDLALAPLFTAEEKSLVGLQTTLFNHALERQAWRYGVEIVDLYTPSRQEVPDHPEWSADDNYHPSDAGYARWAELMWRGIEGRIRG